VAFDQTFASAYIDNGNVHRVLGVKLRPFCSWHQLLLEFIDSPFLSASQCYLYHLRRAVGICRLRYPHSRARPPLGPIIMTKKRLALEVEKFMNYLTDYIHTPDYSVIPFDNFHRSPRPFHPPNPPPGVVQLVFDAAHGANVPIQDAWNMPIGQAYIAQAMYYKHQGVMIDFMDDSEREFQAALKEHLAKGNGAN